MQVVYGQEFSSPFTGSPVSLYKALRKLNPSPYMYFLKIDDSSYCWSFARNFGETSK